MVPSTFSRMKAARCLPVVLAALLFAGCGTQAPDQSAAQLQGATQADSGLSFPAKALWLTAGRVALSGVIVGGIALL